MSWKRLHRLDRQGSLLTTHHRLNSLLRFIESSFRGSLASKSGLDRGRDRNTYRGPLRHTRAPVDIRIALQGCQRGFDEIVPETADYLDVIRVAPERCPVDAGALSWTRKKMCGTSLCFGARCPLNEEPGGLFALLRKGTVDWKTPIPNRSHTFAGGAFRPACEGDLADNLRLFGIGNNGRGGMRVDICRNGSLREGIGDIRPIPVLSGRWRIFAHEVNVPA